MAQRIDSANVSPTVMRAMFGLGAAVEHSGLEHSLVDLVKVRASQLNSHPLVYSVVQFPDALG
jgi:hypothetical protein